MDIKIFIHCDSDISLSRRVLRDVKERGRDVLSILERYNRFVREDFNCFVKPSMKHADIIIPGGAENPSILYHLFSRFRFHLGKFTVTSDESAK